MPKIAPLPRISRTAPTAVRESVKPKPIPTPSSTESSGVFFEAKASARPRIMQFTTISGMKTPSASYRGGV
jgi:hypothetical protein